MNIEKTTRSAHFLRVCEFMQKAGQATPDVPALPDAETRRLRAKLILEEALETITALGFDVEVGQTIARQTVALDDYRLKPNGMENLSQIVDGCADVSVVTIGTMIACGVPDEPVLRLVDENNLAKFGPGGYRRDDGKWVKPHGHRPPDIAWLLTQMIQEVNGI